MADVKNVKVPVLVLHGEKDVRVPVSQAIGFMRGLIREGDEAVSAASKLIIYPREGHIFEERAHAEDQLTRVLAHLQKYIA
jgi:dipeptidyl aminopeptidase/acylaminoacyl peptidase